MKLQITNLGQSPVPIASDQGEGYADTLQPDAPYEYDAAPTVLILGDKPSVSAQISQGLQTIVAVFRAIMNDWASVKAAAEGMPTVHCEIVNQGENAVRAILGDGVTDYDIAPGETFSATAAGYMELRELGLIEEADQPAVA